MKTDDQTFQMQLNNYKTEITILKAALLEVYFMHFNLIVEAKARRKFTNSNFRTQMPYCKIRRRSRTCQLPQRTPFKKS